MCLRKGRNVDIMGNRRPTPIPSSLLSLSQKSCLSVAANWFGGQEEGKVGWGVGCSCTRFSTADVIFNACVSSAFIFLGWHILLLRWKPQRDSAVWKSKCLCHAVVPLASLHSTVLQQLRAPSQNTVCMWEGPVAKNSRENPSPLQDCKVVINGAMQ